MSPKVGEIVISTLCLSSHSNHSAWIYWAFVVWWTRRPGVLWFTRSQRVRHDWATELNCCVPDPALVLGMQLWVNQTKLLIPLELMWWKSGVVEEGEIVWGRRWWFIFGYIVSQVFRMKMPSGLQVLWIVIPKKMLGCRYTEPYPQRGVLKLLITTLWQLWIMC